MLNDELKALYKLLYELAEQEYEVKRYFEMREREKKQSERELRFSNEEHSYFLSFSGEENLTSDSQ